jgi:lipopolysaccharide biosynthesis regulator YciM
MPTRPLIAGYTWNRELARARSADNAARSYLRRILDERPGPALAAFYIAQIGIALGEIADALSTLEHICSHSQEAT